MLCSYMKIIEPQNAIIVKMNSCTPANKPLLSPVDKSQISKAGEEGEDLRLTIEVPDPAVVSRIQDTGRTFARMVDQAVQIGVRHHTAGRIKLHHLAYQTLRRKHTKEGSQRASIAIYRASLVLKGECEPLPGAKAKDVVFDIDRHTASIILRDEVPQLSLRTKGGRIYLKLPSALIPKEFLDELNRGQSPVLISGTLSAGAAKTVNIEAKWRRPAQPENTAEAA